MNVSVVVGLDRSLPDLLQACGAQVTSIEIADLKSLAEPTAQQPDVIVVDARDRSTMPGELAVIKRQHPATGILVVLPRLEGTLVLDAMRAGANAKLVKGSSRSRSQRCLRSPAGEPALANA